MSAQEVQLLPEVRLPVPIPIYCRTAAAWPRVLHDTGRGDNSQLHLCILSPSGPAPSLAQSHQWSEVASSRRLAVCHPGLKTRQNSVIILGEWWQFTESIQSYASQYNQHFLSSIISRCLKEVQMLQRLTKIGCRVCFKLLSASDPCSCGHLCRLLSS